MKFGVRLQKLRCQIADKEVLFIDELEIAFGDFDYRVPIVGGTGVGKSTLLTALALSRRPAGGTLTWSFGDDVEITLTVDDHADKMERNRQRLMRQHVAFAFQDASLIPFLTLDQNLEYVLNAHGRRDRLDSAEAWAKRIYEHDLETWDALKSRLPHQVSGGQKQRFALVRAMAWDPAIILADEPTSNLDPDVKLHVLDLMGEWLKTAGTAPRCMIWVTHDYNTPVRLGANWALRLTPTDGQTRVTRVPVAVLQEQRKVA